MRWHHPSLVTVVLLGTLLAPACGGPEPQDPDASEATDTARTRSGKRDRANARERGPTSVRFDLALPGDVVAPRDVPAWWSRTEADAVWAPAPATVDQGVLTVQVPPGSGVLMLAMPGCVTLTHAIETRRGGASDGGRLELAPSTLLIGRVTDTDGRGVAGADVLPYGRSLGRPPDDAATLTGADGRFEIDGLRRGALRLRVRHEGFVTHRVPHVLQPEGPPLTIVLNRGGLVAGIVATGDGTPLPGAEIRILDLENQRDSSGEERPVVGDDGRFVLRLLPGQYLLHADALGVRRSATVAVQPDGEHEVSIRFPTR